MRSCFLCYFFLLSWVLFVVGFMSSDTFPNTSRHARNTCGNSPKSVHFVFSHVLFFFVLCFRSAPFFLGFSVLVAFLIAARRVENSQETHGNNCAATATTCPATPGRCGTATCPAASPVSNTATASTASFIPPRGCAAIPTSY